MPKTQNFSEHIEKNLVRLGGHVEQQLGSRGEKNLSEREIVKEAIQTLAEDVTKNEITTSSPSPHPVPQINFPSLPSYLQEEGNEDVKRIVEQLVEEALSHDLEKAVRDAKKYSPFIEDAFHDALIDRLVPELKKRGILK
ncbi:MAG: hypothetical protein AB1333_02185 [Patescibacteria group bacterium]